MLPEDAQWTKTTEAGGGAVCEIGDILQTTTAFDEWLLLPERKKRSQMNDDLLSCSHKESLLQPAVILDLLTIFTAVCDKFGSFSHMVFVLTQLLTCRYKNSERHQTSSHIEVISHALGLLHKMF